MQSKARNGLSAGQATLMHFKLVQRYSGSLLKKHPALPASLLWYRPFSLGNNSLGGFQAALPAELADVTENELNWGTDRPVGNSKRLCFVTSRV
jgi:hypothetical protein